MFPNLYLPFNSYPYYRKYNRYNTSQNYIHNPHYNHTLYNNSHSNNVQKSDKEYETISNKIDEDCLNSSEKRNQTESFLFDLFGLKLYFDDILIICLIFFLYTEGVKDESLFIALILLLLT